MAISVNLFQFRGYAIASEDVSYGDGDTQEIKVNQGGVSVPVQFTRKTLTITIRGLIESQVAALDQEARNNRMAMITGSVTGEDLQLGGLIFRRAVLLKVTPTGVATELAGQKLLDAVQLEFQSLVYA